MNDYEREVFQGKIIIWGSVIFLIVFGALTIAASSNRKQPNQSQYRVTSNTDPLYCSRVKVTECGVNLSQCSDGKMYFCMQNVSSDEKGNINEKEDQ